MTSEELVEKVARKMCKSNHNDPDRLAFDGQPFWKHFIPPARAVVALVIEECAKVVDGVRQGELALQCAVDPAQDRASFNHHRAAQMTASDIAAAIRALAPTEGEKG